MLDGFCKTWSKGKLPRVGDTWGDRDPDRWGCPRSREVNLSVVHPCVCVRVRVCVVCVRGVVSSKEPEDTTNGAGKSPCFCSRYISTL